MKKYLSTALIAAIVLGFSGAGMLKAGADVIERGFVSVSSTANTELAPDVVEINIAVQTQDAKSLQKATEENKLISDKVYSALSSMIEKNQGDFIKTANFSASPVYSYKNNKKTLDRYEVSNSIIVHTKAVKDAGKMIDKAIGLGATNINDLNFSISSYDKQCNELLAIAAKKAYLRANILASSANNTLNGIKSINGSCSTANNAVPYRMLAKNIAMDSMSAGSAETSSSPIQGGIIKLYANLNAAYFVK